MATATHRIDDPFSLHTAASNGHLDLVELLLDEENPPYDDPDGQGRTPLILAAAGGHPDVVELLLEFEQADPNNTSNKLCVDVNHRAEDGSTALKAALAAESAEAAEVLLRHPGIDVGHTLKYAEDWTPLGAASILGYLKVVKAIVKSLTADKSPARCEKHRGESLQGTPLYLASDGGHIKVVKVLIKDEYWKDVNKNYINDTSVGGKTALFAAAMNGHADVVDLLLKKGADTTKKSSDGLTPLEATIIGRHTAVVKLLFEHRNKKTGGTRSGTEETLARTEP